MLLENLKSPAMGILPNTNKKQDKKLKVENSINWL